MSRNNLNLTPKCKGARSKDTRVRAPNEPRIIVAPFHDTPLTYRRHLFAICERNREGRPRRYWLCEYVRVVKHLHRLLCRFATPGDNRWTTRYRSRVSWDVVDYVCRILKGSEMWRSMRYIRIDRNIYNNFSNSKDRVSSISRIKEERRILLNYFIKIKLSSNIKKSRPILNNRYKTKLSVKAGS